MVEIQSKLKERFNNENPGFEICIPSIKYCTDKNTGCIRTPYFYLYSFSKAL